jgi:ribosomal protein S18
MNRLRALLATAAIAFSASASAAFDHTHAAWDALLKKHVKLIDGGKASQVRYADFAKDRAALKAYLAELSKVTPAQFAAWPKAERMAFLVNAYNAYTVELILTKYPDLKSIRDLGNLVFNSPWKQKFFTLFGEPWWLDRIEHETLRKPGAYDEPRVHYAVNCASIGCPSLREEAFVAARLEAQLEEQARRFLSDRSRNRFNAATGKLEVSEIFKWFKEDWTSGYKGLANGAPITSREQYFAKYADLLADKPEHRKLVAEGKAPLDHPSYDWSLNDAR